MSTTAELDYQWKKSAILAECCNSIECMATFGLTAERIKEEIAKFIAEKDAKLRALLEAQR